MCPYLPTYCYSLLLEGRFWQQRAFVLFSGKQPRSAARQERQTVKKRELLKPWLRKKVNFWRLLFLTAEFDRGERFAKALHAWKAPLTPPPGRVEAGTRICLIIQVLQDGRTLAFHHLQPPCLHVYLFKSLAHAFRVPGTHRHEGVVPPGCRGGGSGAASPSWPCQRVPFQGRHHLGVFPLALRWYLGGGGVSGVWRGRGGLLQLCEEGRPSRKPHQWGKTLWGDRSCGCGWGKKPPRPVRAPVGDSGAESSWVPL